MPEGNAHAISSPFRGWWQRLGLYHMCLWSGLFLRVCSYPLKETGIRVRSQVLCWSFTSLVISQPSCSSSRSWRIDPYSSKWWFFPKTVTFRTLYTLQQCELAGYRFGWCSVSGKWEAEVDMNLRAGNAFSNVSGDASFRINSCRVTVPYFKDTGSLLPDECFG